ncbi:SMI1/KNR4 family protein [Saccharothrix longispora]|uniref:SMI1/KNR4 family protein n=1 Tax=Saccharothrix longispora TaxID=33920 RepID=UPI0028FD3C45|nr:SMI1/KNR4 family protein [Saccharothrix longispora]MDU0294013.1 SMI1/KNR4 family protein [Saccharothrix longispora]
MSAPVASSWDRIEQWLRHNAPDTSLRPPVEAPAVTAVEAVVGHRLPDDLVQSLLRHDGTPAPLVPSRWKLMPLETAVETWRRNTEDLTARQAAEIDDDEDDDEDWSETGEEEEDAFWGWNPAWLPIAADDSGCHLVVELREGRHHGVVGVLDPESGPRFEGYGTWPSTAALLEGTANALHGDDPVWKPALEPWGIDWTR